MYIWGVPGTRRNWKMVQASRSWLWEGNGLVSVEERALSPLDRGLLLGDGAFETIRVLFGHPYLLEAHIERIMHTLQELSLNVDSGHLLQSCQLALMEWPLYDAMLRLTVTRGAGGQGYLPLNIPTPTILITMTPLTLTLSDLSPLHVGISQWRKIPPQCLPTQGKTLQGLNATLARIEANSAEMGEMLQCSINGSVACFSSGNLFWRSNGVTYTPPLATGCLAGITRQRLIQLMPDITEAEVMPDQLAEADAVILTNSRVLARAVCKASLANCFVDFPDSESLATQWTDVLKNDAKIRAMRHQA